jgi:hypothetical protein
MELKFVEVTGWTLEVWRGSYIVGYIMDWKYNPTIHLMPENAAEFDIRNTDVMAAFEAWKRQ